MALLLVLFLLPHEGLQARTKKGDKFYKLGEAAEARKDYDKALDDFQKALSQDPKDAAYDLAARPGAVRGRPSACGSGFEAEGGAAA